MMKNYLKNFKKSIAIFKNEIIILTIKAMKRRVSLGKL